MASSKRPGLSPALAAATLLVGAGLAMAETSSWTSSVDGPAAPVERKPATTKPGAVKIIKTVPQADAPGADGAAREIERARQAGRRPATTPPTRPSTRGATSPRCSSP